MHVYQQKRIALGSEALVTLASPRTEDQLIPIFTEVWDRLAVFEQQCSRFIPDSELSKFNARAGQEVTVTPAFRLVLAAAASAAHKTDGLYNPFVLPALFTAGYRNSWIDAKADTGNYDNKSVVPIERLILGTHTAQIPKDTALDLGGCGKGYALDMLATFLSAEGVQDYWVSLGGDIIARGGPEKGGSWDIGIASASAPTQTIATVTTGDPQVAIATSGITKRKGIQNGTAWHHIIDPRTALPAETDIATATICMPSGIMADVYASCLVIVGAHEVPRYIRQHDISDALIQTTTQHITTYGKVIRRI